MVATGRTAGVLDEPGIGQAHDAGLSLATIGQDSRDLEHSVNLLCPDSKAVCYAALSAADRPML